MRYDAETITDEKWERMRECSDILRRATVRPLTRVIDRAQGDFMVEVGNSDSRGELFRRCVYVTHTRSLLVTVTEPSFGKYQFSWQVWDGISEQELNMLNERIGEAVEAHYPFTAENLNGVVGNNPYHEIPSEILVELINTKVNLWYSHKRLKILRKQTEKLKQGKQSFLMWRFYLAKWQGVPKYEAIDSHLINMITAYFINPKHKAILIDHLAQGGEGLSDDTKRVLAYINDSDR